MIRIDMSTPSSERGITARIFPIAPRPALVEQGEGKDEQVPASSDDAADAAAEVPDSREDQQQEPQAKVVRSPQRKAPHGTQGVRTK